MAPRGGSLRLPDQAKAEARGWWATDIYRYGFNDLLLIQHFPVYSWGDHFDATWYHHTYLVMFFSWCGKMVWNQGLNSNFFHPSGIHLSSIFWVPKPKNHRRHPIRIALQNASSPAGLVVWISETRTLHECAERFVIFSNRNLTWIKPCHWFQSIFVGSTMKIFKGSGLMNIKCYPLKKCFHQPIRRSGTPFEVWRLPVETRRKERWGYWLLCGSLHIDFAANVSFTYCW